MNPFLPWGKSVPIHVREWKSKCSMFYNILWENLVQVYFAYICTRAYLGLEVGGADLIVQWRALKKFTIYAHAPVVYWLGNAIILIGCCTMYTTTTLSQAVDDDQ